MGVRVLAEQTNRIALAAQANQLFNALPAPVRADWTPELHMVTLTAGQRLSGGGEDPFIHLPLDVVVSLSTTAKDGSAALLALIGREGMVGLASLLGAPLAHAELEVLVKGQAVRVSSALLVQAFREHEDVRLQILRYLNAAFTQIGQAVYCYRHHPPEGYVATLLLRIQERTGGPNIQLTQEQMGRLAGLRRETISHAAARLQDCGALSYHRGLIQVHDRAVMESRACECYSFVKDAYVRCYSVATLLRDE